MPVAGMRTLKQVEEEYIREVLSLCEGRVQKAAAVLGMGRATLYRRVKQMGIEGVGRARPETEAAR